MKKILITVLHYFILINSVSAVEFINNLPAFKDKIYVFIAYESIEDLKYIMGQWLPIQVISVEQGKKIQWKISQAERISNELHLNFTIIQINGDQKTYPINFSNYGVDEKFVCTVTNSPNEIRISIPSGRGAPRDLLIAFHANYEILSKIYSISEAAPLWKWDKTRIVNLENQE